jgi:hypothetical protein
MNCHLFEKEEEKKNWTTSIPLKNTFQARGTRLFDELAKCIGLAYSLISVWFFFFPLFFINFFYLNLD